jgi:hypothetical protein
MGRGRAGHAAAPCRAQGRAEPRVGRPRRAQGRGRATGEQATPPRHAACKAGAGPHGREEEGGRRGRVRPGPTAPEGRVAMAAPPSAMTPGWGSAVLGCRGSRGRGGRDGGRTRGGPGAHHGRGDGDVDGRRRGELGKRDAQGKERMRVVGED